LVIIYLNSIVKQSPIFHMKSTFQTVPVTNQYWGMYVFAKGNDVTLFVVL